MTNVEAVGTAYGSAKVVGVGMSLTVGVPFSMATLLEIAANSFPLIVSVGKSINLGLRVILVIIPATDTTTPSQFLDHVRDLFHFVKQETSEITSESGSIIDPDSSDLENLIVMTHE